MSGSEDSTLYSSRLLPFQRTILNELVPSSNSNSSGNTLLILARGLGLRSIVQTLVCFLSSIYTYLDLLFLICLLFFI